MSSTYGGRALTRAGGHEVVAVYGGRPAAEIARGLLESHGIEAELLADDDGGLAPVAALTEGVRVIVPTDRAAQARALLTSEVTGPVDGGHERRTGSTIRLAAGFLAALLVAAIVYSVVEAL